MTCLFNEHDLLITFLLCFRSKVLSKIQEELKTCRKELHASKETFKKLLMEKSLLEQKVQRLERMTNEEV